jgi:dUTPase
MIIKGTSKNYQFFDRKHHNDVGLDIGLPYNATLTPGLNTIDLEVQVEIPNGYMGLLLPRSSAAKAGINAIPVPIDPGYTGNIHAFLINNSNEVYQYKANSCLVQLVLIPVAITNVVEELQSVRGDKAFNSSGR